MNKIFKYILVFTILISTMIISPLNSVHADESTGDTKELFWPEAPALVSGAAILMDADTGAILYEKNAHEKIIPQVPPRYLRGF